MSCSNTLGHLGGTELEEWNLLTDLFMLMREATTGSRVAAELGAQAEDSSSVAVLGWAESLRVLGLLGEVK